MNLRKTNRVEIFSGLLKFFESEIYELFLSFCWIKLKISFSSEFIAVIDGVDTSSMTREQLEAFAMKLRNEMEREREERSFFQIERDKLRTFWEITRKQLEEAQAVIRNKEREVEVAQELADLDTKNVMQQMKVRVPITV